MQVASRAPRLFVVDDEPEVHRLVGHVAQQLGFEVFSHTTGERALATVSETRPDVAIVDLRMPGMSGMDVLRALLAIEPDLQVILMTGGPTIESAVDAVKAGALDYLAKPFDLARLNDLLVTVRESIRRRERFMEADAALGRQFEFYGMVGRSAQMQRLFDSIRRLAPYAQTVLITGETGTGKELVARAFHQLGPRCDRRFVTVNCAAVVETLFESELFGHVRGAFTGADRTKTGLFEHADGGALFLDEVGELPLTIQAKLLRAVESGEIQRVGSLETLRTSVRIIAATNRNLRADVTAGRFRSDLFYRLSVVETDIVPLRERREDIPYLVAKFVRDAAARFNKSIVGVTAGAERLLQQAPWYGNIRELKNIVERACILSGSRLLNERDVAKGMVAHSPPPAAASGATNPSAMPINSPVPAASQDQVEAALRQSRGNKAEAARLLGVNRRTLYRWLDKSTPGPGG